ncbi:MAG: hypothetical protein A2X11_12550 [Bacteroidetes bacterium GWE2_42_24]|nr:MAG: hypothetical protein A2X11_12550 [Bacteroidetes bacterium GWE2_42_24]OFY30608.1 MAG: hypothetical protein A2X09_03800 [Bacteroidetes bacterium GWF2_43_11]
MYIDNHPLQHEASSVNRQRYPQIYRLRTEIQIKYSNSGLVTTCPDTESMVVAFNWNKLFDLLNDIDDPLSRVKDFESAQ